VVLEWKIMVLSPPNVPASDGPLPLKGRLIRAFLRALVGAFKAGKTFVPRIGLVSAGVVGREDPAGGNPPPRAFAGFGGEPAFASMVAVM